MKRRSKYNDEEEYRESEMMRHYHGRHELVEENDEMMFESAGIENDDPEY